MRYLLVGLLASVVCFAWSLAFWNYLADGGAQALAQTADAREGGYYGGLLRSFLGVAVAVTLVVFFVLLLIFEVSRLGTAVAIAATGFGGSLAARADPALWSLAGSEAFWTHLCYYASFWILAGIVGAYFGRPGRKSPLDP